MVRADDFTASPSTSLQAPMKGRTSMNGPDKAAQGSMMDILKSSRHSRITGDFGEALVLYWLSKYGFECARIDHTGIDLIARNPHMHELMGISVKSRSRGCRHRAKQPAYSCRQLRESAPCMRRVFLHTLLCHRGRRGQEDSGISAFDGASANAASYGQDQHKLENAREVFEPICGRPQDQDP